MINPITSFNLMQQTSIYLVSCFCCREYFPDDIHVAKLDLGFCQFYFDVRHCRRIELIVAFCFGSPADRRLGIVLSASFALIVAPADCICIESLLTYLILGWW